MTVTGNSDTILSELSNLISELQKEREEASKKINSLDKQIEAIETTMRLIRHSGKHVEQPDAYDKLIEKLKKEKSKGNFSQEKALETIARDMGKNGVFKVQDAKRIMLSVGILKKPKGANSIMYALIGRNEKFEKIKPGVYKLIDTDTNKS